ncbi:stage II sporulation protein R [Effusibacillus lacus]|uniref:Stage II sporulation protein R n=1 Tax=Effusibacillus lacus TaxID=1348429 RepID=A0A292YM54_9BACL|nr:stage II sporulation protein R [Effusibacillus lacus]TCS71848.1 stage II sporulation protein R [Effusibacillus lacus]GAX89585.1 stage II sporulation protein R [Effusibacillus lacus]
MRVRSRVLAGVAGWVLAGTLLTGSQAGFVASADEYAGTTVVDEEAPLIPNDAVRLRIIANSDSPEDQALKRQIRDRIIDEVGRRLRGAGDRQQARQVIEANVPIFTLMAAQAVKEAGYSYTVKTDYGRVPFPTKVYGNNVYPAGEYEALRIVVGEGKGQNWWCVLFPPLCFVDLANGDAVQAKDMEAKSEPLATIEVPAGENQTAQMVQVRLGIVDGLKSLFEKIGEFLKSLFA